MTAEIKGTQFAAPMDPTDPSRIQNVVVEKVMT